MHPFLDWPQVRDLTPFALALEFVVEEYAGGRGKTPPIMRRRKKVVYVATIEKASGLINSLAESGRLNSLGLVVVDEVRRREFPLQGSVFFPTAATHVGRRRSERGHPGDLPHQDTLSLQ